ncbi:MAG: LruC domain-containing protein [Bacteriovoracaceae bacterium]|nr:LruC domain-containing protein [Bacteriovoracaceae bacterium]
MKTKLVLLILTSIGVIFNNSCKKLPQDEQVTTSKRTPKNAPSNRIVKKAPDNFNFSNVKTIKISEYIKYRGEVLRNTAVVILDKDNNVLMKMSSDSDGLVEVDLNVPSHVNVLYIEPLVLGTNIRVPILAKTHLDTSFLKRLIAGLGNLLLSKANASSVFYSGDLSVGYLASEVDNLGVPNNIENVNQKSCPANFLKRLTSSLPNGKSVKNNRPHYISSNMETSTHITKATDVWITLVDDGQSFKTTGSSQNNGWGNGDQDCPSGSCDNNNAENSESEVPVGLYENYSMSAGDSTEKESLVRNALGFFTYPTSSPPKSLSEIENLKIILPNVLLKKNGGGLNSGDTVYLGKFDAGISIGYFIISDSWDYINYRNTAGSGFYTSISPLNPEAVGLERHNVQLWDRKCGKVVIGFEDSNRESSRSDDDFNDVLFYVSTAQDSIDNSNIQSVAEENDSDGDGVTDAEDAYPQDGDRSYDNFFPLEGRNGVLLFEDSWPHMGDYDFNDLVLEYNFNYISNSIDQVKEIKAKITIKATGASQNNGVAIMFNTKATNVESVTGSLISEDYISLNINGTEEGIDQAVVILCDNVNKFLPKFSNVYHMNIQPYTFEVSIVFTSPINRSLLGAPPYRPFLIKNLDRSSEIHQVDYVPTRKHNKGRFNKGDDSSDPESGLYYKNTENMPWVLNVPFPIAHPKEKVPIYDAYYYFSLWALSGGTNYKDWYFQSSDRINLEKTLY